jgi:hypothetical protein
VQNLREGLQRLLDRQQEALKAARTPPAPPPATDGDDDRVVAPPRSTPSDEPALTRAEHDQADVEAQQQMVFAPQRVGYTLLTTWTAQPAHAY